MPQHICILAQTLFSARNFRGPLIDELLQLGHKVTVLAPDEDEKGRDFWSREGLQVGYMPLDRTGLNPFRDVMLLMFLWRFFRARQPNVVLSYAAKTNVWGLIAALMAGIKRRVVMVEGLGYAFTDFAANKKEQLKKIFLRAVQTWLYKIALLRAHAVVVLNSDDKNFIINQVGVDKNKVFLMNGIGVCLKTWSYIAPLEHPVTFVFVGRLLLEKGVLEFLQAAEILKKDFPEVRFLLLGAIDNNPGSLSPQQIERYVARGVAVWPGSVNVKDWLKDTSVFVLPSYYREGLPRSTQEAMAMGRAVITTDVPGCRETVIDGENGFLVPPKDVEALVEAMKTFVTRPELILKMGIQSRKLAEERFDVRRANAILLGLMGFKHP